MGDACENESRYQEFRCRERRSGAQPEIGDYEPWHDILQIVQVRSAYTFNVWIIERDFPVRHLSVILIGEDLK